MDDGGRRGHDQKLTSRVTASDAMMWLYPRLCCCLFWLD